MNQENNTKLIIETFTEIMDITFSTSIGILNKDDPTHKLAVLVFAIDSEILTRHIKSRLHREFLENK